ncbi:FAD-dependent oxidoreductase [Burkholderia diffusa]|uniref:FAD-dependent oxidoreductase n=1 Tax=Burkholderia diffusa TaxID=488732 RepID=UPI000758DF94|nr:FAD-dependent oxidoreductase [Burkholderia diffusa]KVH42798.1 pyridine nucleotide-disulfide oxidoreductase [Burkholderia diffusa]
MTARSGGERDYDHVLVGGGIAGVSAAHALRREDPFARIAILCGEHVLPYQRQPLTKEFLAGNVAPAAIAIHPAGFYEMRRIDLHLGARVASVDCGAHVVRLEDGAPIRYGKLLIASGAAPRRLTVPGATLAGIGHLHDLDDALALRDNAARHRRLLVLGGGFTGIEAAATLRERGLEVTLVERCERLLPQLNSARLSDHFAGLCATHGVDVRTGTTVERFIGTQSVKAAVLADGCVIECDLVVVAVGVEPNCEFLAGSGIATADGVLVDECLQASDPDVHAAGDVARFRDPVFGVQRRIEHWDNAVRQGRLAARNMRGARLPYRDVSIFYGNVFDVPYNFLGNAADATEVVEQGRFPHAPYSLLYLRHHVLRAVFSIGVRADEMTAAEETIRHRVNLGAQVEAATHGGLRLRELPAQTVLILQGGGALGAFESGAIAALEARGVRPDVVAAVSIGAFNGAIAASHPGHAAEALDAFWRELSIRSPVGVPSCAYAGHALLAWHVALFGVPNFLRPHWWPDAIPPPGLAPWWTSCYDTQPMLALLRRHVDFDALAGSATRLLLGAVDVESGERRIFDSYVDRITPEHLLASGSLPPAMPWTQIDGRAYWDGGIISNSPLDLVIERCGRIAGRVFVVDLFSGSRPLPSNLLEVMLRRDEIVYADRVRNDLRFEENANDFRDLVERITSRLDPETAARMRQLPEYIRLMGNRAPVRVFRIALDRLAGARDTFARDFDFSDTSIATLFELGRSAALAVLASDATEPLGGAAGHPGRARPPAP